MKKLVFSLCLIVILSLFAAACQDQSEEPGQLSYDGIRLTVWDARQPRLPGDHLYEDEVSRSVESFQQLYGVEINYVFVDRSEILDFLSGDSVTGDPPALVYSGEWPVTSDMMVDLSQYIDTTQYNSGAIDSWTVDGKLLGIPSFYHWLASAAKCRGEDKITGYWLESPALFPVALGPYETWNLERTIQFAQWLEDSYESYVDNPLADWLNNKVSHVFPVTPYMFKWLQIHTGEEVCLFPLDSPFCEPMVYATVPAYCVLVEEEPYTSCAVELGKTLAVNLGRWSIRVTGTLPAAAGDMPIFHLESGFEYENRLFLMNILEKKCLEIPNTADYVKRCELEERLFLIFSDFLGSGIDLPETSRRIQDLFAGNTKISP